MNPNIKILIIFSIVIIFIVTAVTYNNLDPFVKTDKYVEAVIIKRIYSTGKAGATLGVIVKTETGEELRFPGSHKYTKQVGGKVKLQIYRRLKTGAEKYVMK